MLARLERQRAKSGTVKLSVTLLLFCHVNAVMTGNFVSTAPAHVLGNVRGFHLSFAVLLAASHCASGRSCERPTDQLDTGFLAASVLQTNAVTVPNIPSCY